MILGKELTIEEILDEMNDLKKRINSIATILRIKMEPLKGIEYKDVVSKGSNVMNDVMLNRIIKTDELAQELEAKKESYNDYRRVAVEKIQKMREEKSVDEMIVFYRDKLHWKWREIAKITNYSSRQCLRKYKNYCK